MRRVADVRHYAAWLPDSLATPNRYRMSGDQRSPRSRGVLAASHPPALIEGRESSPGAAVVKIDMCLDCKR
jgi:hypothetical protein